MLLGYTDAKGNTPLGYLLEHGSGALEILEWMLERNLVGPTLLSTPCRKGKAPITYLEKVRGAEPVIRRLKREEWMDAHARHKQVINAYVAYGFKKVPEKKKRQTNDFAIDE